MDENSTDPIRGRGAVVTGAAGGIGVALARAFGRRGARLVLADLSEERLGDVARAMQTEGYEVAAVPTDVTRPDSVEALARQTFDRFGTAHIVCNNAGVSLMGEMWKAPYSEWKFVMDVNFWGVVHGVRAFVPRLVEQGDGHVVNTASMAGLVGMSWLGIYAASKFAVVGLSESLRRELAPHGVAVSVLCPMIVDTQINRNSARLLGRVAGVPEPEVPSAATGAMQGGVVSPEHVAARVVEGIEQRRLHILTHPEQRAFLARRSARLDAAFEGWAD